MAKKVKTAATKPATTKPTKAKPVKAAAKPAKPTAKTPAAPRAAKKPAAPVAALPQKTVAPAPSPSLADRYASFEDAKNATIDSLLATIEAAEARLLEVKRSTSFEQLEPLANGAGQPHS